MSTAVLLVNLGTPDSPSVKDVRVYLKEFLSDPRVIDINPIGRFFLVNFIIAPLRAPKSAREYKKLFDIGNGASPLMTHTEELTKKVDALNESFDTYFAMRYGNPSMESILKKIQKKNYDKIILFPLYPQYASATTGSIIEKAFEIINRWWVIPEVSVIGQFYDDDKYIQLVANRAKQFDLDSYDHVLFSYHGVPERHVDKTYTDGTLCKDHNCETTIDHDNKFCYKATCYGTTRLLAEKLGLKESDYTTVYQSRLGKTPWLEPYADQEIIKLAKEGKKNLLVFSPAFVADCLETILEIGEGYQELFEEYGGVKLDLVPSLNSQDDWAEYIYSSIKKAL